jgi:hypothetical protein
MTRGAHDIELSPVGPPQALPRDEGFKVVATEISLRGEAIRLLVKDNSAVRLFARTEQPGWASFPKTETEGEYSAIFSIYGADGAEEFQLPSLRATFPQIQVFPNGEMLVVAPRCRRFSDGTYELNATVYDSSGALRREFLLGDGIEHVQIDRKGNIWVGYFDEGVYGNFGWSHPNGPVGSTGLTCFDENGVKLWGFQPPAGFDVISDCYALNVSKDGVWTYYYTDFPLVRIDSGWNVRAWKTQTTGGREFAIHAEKVLFFGGYGEHRNECKLLRLGDETAELLGEVKLLLPSDVDLAKAVVIGRDNKLHVFYSDDWYVFSIASLN